MFGSMLAAGVGAGLSLANNWLNTSGPLAKSANKLSLGQYNKQKSIDLKYQKMYDEYKSALDFDYAQRYAQHSAKWQMEGLKAADLNPILAVTNGSMAGTFGQPSSGSASGGGVKSRMSNSDPSLAAAQMAATARQNALVDEQIKQVKAQTDNILQDTANKAATNGLTGTPAALSVLANKLGITDVHSAKDAVNKAVKGTWHIGDIILRGTDGQIKRLSPAMQAVVKSSRAFGGTLANTYGPVQFPFGLLRNDRVVNLLRNSVKFGEGLRKKFSR